MKRGSLSQECSPEINTNARALDKMHQLYLKWQFKIPSESVSNDFRTDAKGSPTDRSRPNRIAYELALKLAADTRSPLFNAIQFQEPDKSSAPRARMKKHLIVKATNWMQKARRWFSNQGVYSDPQSDAYSSEEVLNFFIAFQNTCNHDEWEDGLNRWKDPEEKEEEVRHPATRPIPSADGYGPVYNSEARASVPEPFSTIHG